MKHDRMNDPKVQMSDMLYRVTVRIPAHEVSTPMAFAEALLKGDQKITLTVGSDTCELVAGVKLRHRSLPCQGWAAAGVAYQTRECFTFAGFPQRFAAASRAPARVLHGP
jgi:kynurenine formamidase